MGDPSSHGGKVLEGSQFDICHGKPIAYIGHKVYCPKCKGTYPIVEGAMTTSVYGKGVALAGMKTACGATLIATQFTDIVEHGGGTGGGARTHSLKSGLGQGGRAVSGADASDSGIIGATMSSGESESKFDEQSHLAASAIEGVPYFIETKDGRRFTGRAPHDGLLPRVETYEAGEYTVYWADEALARMTGAD
jgi:uncharacterized Zn-binding protein involved in type VI secretion